MTQRTKCTCQLIVGITGTVMGVAAWATAGHMVLLGNWLRDVLDPKNQGLR